MYEKNTAATETAAANLYDGGWRAEDREELMKEHELTAEEADAICEELKKLAARANES